MKTQNTHTPTPWKVDTNCIYRDGYIFVRVGQCPITADNADANTRHIVKCVNAHDELVAALREVKAACPRYCDDDGINAGLLRIMQTVNYALTLAEGGSK